MQRSNLKLRSLVAAVLTAATLLAPLTGAIAEATTLKAKSNVNVRAGSDATTEKVGYAYSGQVAKYLGTENGWYKIDLDGIVGFTHRDYWQGNTVTATTSVNVRRSANTLAEKVALAATGTEATVLGRSGSWLFIDINGTKGYSYKSYWDLSDTLFYSLSVVTGEVETTTPAPTPNPEPTPDPAPTAPGEVRTGDEYGLINTVNGYGTAADAAARVRSVRVMNQGKYYVYRIFSGMYNITTVKDTPGAWINPADNNGTAAPAPAPGTEQETTSALGERIVKNALGVLGAPYVYAGESWAEGGFDCSGLTYYAYLKEGIRLPRTASQQWAGISNKVSVPQPGDIIAFEREDGSVYHVGIYYKDGTMIHSPKPGYFVEIKSLDWYYRNDLIKGYLRPTK